MTDERSERLRKRRKKSERNTRARASGQNQPTDSTSSTTNQQTASETETVTDTEPDHEPVDASHESSVKDEQVGTYMYLPKSQTKDLKRLYNVLKAEYEFEYDEEFEKNRHFYPLVVQHGLDSLDSFDASDIRNHLEEI